MEDQGSRMLWLKDHRLMEERSMQASPLLVPLPGLHRDGPRPRPLRAPPRRPRTGHTPGCPRHTTAITTHERDL